jgi:hypothetical protein
MKLKTYMVTILLLPVIFLSNVFAYDLVGVTKINFVENSWTGTGLAIHTDVGIAGCPAPDTEFYIDGAHPSYNELVSIALTAFTAQKKRTTCC